MKQKHLMIIAIACGIACAACIVLFMMSVQSEANAARAEALARYGGEQVEVCVATRDIAAGERIELSALEMRMWIADLLPEGAVRESSDVVGKTASTSILKGEVVSEKRFETERSDFEIPAGMTAVSVPAKAVQAVGGAIRSGMSVDVYSSGDSTTTALARDVLVLDSSVGGAGSFMSGDSGCLILAVEPEHVEEIISASNKTTLYFVLPGETLEKDKKKRASDENGVEGESPVEHQGAEDATGSASAGALEGSESADDAESAANTDQTA